MSAELERIAERVREIADRLRAPDLAEEEAEALAREAADLLGEAGGALERALRRADASRE